MGPKSYIYRIVNTLQDGPDKSMCPALTSKYYISQRRSKFKTGHIKKGTVEKVRNINLAIVYQ